jgi:hypothetical protein
LALASARTTRKHGRHRTPPMAYVEETAPDEPIQNCPEHLLFTVPDNWNPPTVFGNETKLPAPEPLTDAGKKNRQRTSQSATSRKNCRVAVTRRLTQQAEHLQRTTTQQNSQPAGQLSRANAEKEGTHAQGPNPLSTVQKEWEDQPPHINLGYLELLFETRSMVDDQIFRAIQIGHRLDMMYATHSRASPRLQCPTCAQAYAIPAGWRKKGDAGESTG